MKHYTRVLLLLCALVFSGQNLSGAGDPKNLMVKTIEEAMEVAKRDSRLVLVDFNAAWCSPCRWMDKTTFTDPEVQNLIHSGFVHLRADIDDIKGFELKNLYKVKYLPTILILNASGQMLERIEETITPRVMVNILKNNLEGEIASVKKFNTNVAPGAKSNKEATPVFSDGYVDPLLSEEDFLKYFQHQPGRKTYRILAGTYHDHNTALEQVNMLKSRFKEPIQVFNEVHEGKVIFKVCVGQFFKPEEAQQFRETFSRSLQQSSKVI